MKICILSDSHDHRGALISAMTDAKEKGAEAVLHAGDVVAPSTLGGVRTLGLPVHVIHGNNMGDLVMMCKIASHPNQPIHYYGMDATLELGGRRIFIVHYPHYARAMAVTGSYDIVCHGHDHRANIERIQNIKGGMTVLADPGNVAGLDGPATYILADLETLDFQLQAVPGA